VAQHTEGVWYASGGKCGGSAAEQRALERSNICGKRGNGDLPIHFLPNVKRTYGANDKTNEMNSEDKEPLCETCSFSDLKKREIPSGYEVTSFPTQADRNLAEFLWDATGDLTCLCEDGKAPSIEKDEDSLYRETREKLRERLASKSSHEFVSSLLKWVEPSP